MRVAEDPRCPRCHDVCRVIARFCPSCGAKVPSALLAKCHAPTIDTILTKPAPKAPVKKRRTVPVSLEPLPKAKLKTRSNQSGEAGEACVVAGSTTSAPLPEAISAPVAAPPKATPKPVLKRGIEKAQSKHPIHVWMLSLQDLLTKLTNYTLTSPTQADAVRTSRRMSLKLPVKRIKRAKRVALENKLQTLETEFTLRFDDDSGAALSANMSSRCSQLLVHARALLDRLEPMDAASPVEKGVVVVKVEGTTMRFKGRTLRVTPEPPTTAPEPAINLHCANKHMYTRGYMLHGVYVLLGVYELDSDAVRLALYDPQTSIEQTIVLGQTQLARLAPQEYPLYLKRDLPAKCNLSLVHWMTWFNAVLRHRLHPDATGHWHLRFPSVYRKPCTLFYKGGDTLFRCLLAVHVQLDYAVEFDALDVSTGVMYSTLVPHSHMQLAASRDFAQHVLDVYRWTPLFEGLVRQLYMERTTRGYELVFAGMPPRGRIVHGAAPHDAEWAAFLEDERAHLMSLRAQCAQLAASSALRQAHQRADDLYKLRVLQLQTAACGRIQRHWRGYRGRRHFQNRAFDRALAFSAWGLLPRCTVWTTSPYDAFRWYQDPDTLVVHAIPASTLAWAPLVLRPRPSTLALVCGARIRTPFDVLHRVAPRALVQLRMARAAVKIQSHIKRLVAQRCYKDIVTAVVFLQYCVRSRRREASRRTVWRCARRIRGTLVLILLRAPVDADALVVTVFHPTAAVGSSQVVPKAAVGDSTGMRALHVIAAATDLFYSAQKQLLAFHVGPRPE
ncbi:hypothetical protein ACHHYP_04350 [Achlya hypogyna]|uniref:Uncharacterized protein n=1 Tax=Achlya hypogyna TaxID=1202772 RepID=A0A1V9Z1C6_ACHHY|nr:hypothetical protein ACHHYP_04350 [Achlya hypogyna]